MNVQKLIGAATATAIAIGIVTAAPASATDNIRAFGEQEKLLGPNFMPIIGYTVDNFTKSKAPVPHNGTLYTASLNIDFFGGSENPRIEQFGARAESGAFYPVVRDSSNFERLYFDVVGDEPNSVVWNDGTRDILAWIKGPKEGGNRP